MFLMLWCAEFFFDFFFFFSSRRRHTRCREVSWARRCVQETGINAEYMGSRAITSRLRARIRSSLDNYQEPEPKPIVVESPQAIERTSSPFHRNINDALKSEAMLLSTQQGSVIRISALVSPRNVKSTAVRRINYATCDSPASRAQQREEFTRKLREEIQMRNMKLLESQKLNEEPTLNSKNTPKKEVNNSRQEMHSQSIASQTHPAQSVRPKRIVNNFIQVSNPCGLAFPRSAKSATSKKINFEGASPTAEKYSAVATRPARPLKLKPRGMFAEELDILKEKIKRLIMHTKKQETLIKVLSRATKLI
eukprot:TRINITY_DN9980_c0_g1_i1.p1 TRINITY_DN9980_c0_g1~~TRINITY_DN9980_c0_g1_i1.p1  ORF type:complete len:308 (+),score=67.33 TRINITY_DN9980_c0_g1_i1:50-973(+)